MKVFAQEVRLDINLTDTSISNEVRAYKLGRLNSSSNQNGVEISHSIEGPYFVEGMYGVNNKIGATGAPSEANKVLFLAMSSDSYNYYGESNLLNIDETWNLDMGNLKPDAIVYGILYDINNDLVGTTEIYVPKIIKKPSWLEPNIYKTSFFTGVVVDNQNNMIDLNAHVLLQASTKKLPVNIPGLGNRSFGIEGEELIFKIRFNCGTGNTNLTEDPSFDLSMNVFDLTKKNYSISFDEGNFFQFDSAFNPKCLLEKNISRKLFDIEWPLGKIPTFPLVDVNITGGINASGTLKGLIDINNNDYDSSILFKNVKLESIVTTTPRLSISAAIICDDIASIKGSVFAELGIKSTLDYSELNSPLATQKLEGNVKIYGEVSTQAFLGFFKKRLVDYTFFERQISIARNSRLNEINNDSTAEISFLRRFIQSNPILKTPEFFAQPVMSANDSALYCVWLDYNNSQTQLLLSKLDYSTRYFSDPVLVAEGEMISNPKVTTLTSGNAIVSWTQNRYSSNNFDTSTMNFYDLLQGQDIWVSHYDKTTNTADDPVIIFDDTSSLSSGRAEGNANIIMGKGNYGLLTWVAKDDIGASNSDVWYSSIEETSDGDVNTTSNPSKITDLSGVNKGINVSYYDSANAIATWINDPDGNDSTLNDIVVMRFWDQHSQTWEDIDTLVSNDGTISFQELSNDFNGIYGSLAISYTQYDSLGNFQKKLKAFVWDPNQDDWSSNPYEFYDSSKDISQLKVSVNKNGIVSLTYQTTNLFLDSAEIDPGKIIMVVNDSKNQPNVWNLLNSNNNLLGDSSVFDWSINTTYGDGNNFYIITQEADNITGNAPLDPPFGVRFGRDSLNLVLRVLDVTPAGINDVQEPDTKLYTFTGNGNWSVSSNWKNNEVPPMHLPEGSHILIDPISGGACNLNVTQYVNGNSSVTILAEKKFIIPGKLEIK